MVTQGYTATLVAATLTISRSSLYYRKKPRGSRADRTYIHRRIVYSLRSFLRLWTNSDSGERMKQSKCVQEPQNYGDHNHRIQNRLKRSLHRYIAID